MQGTRRAIVSGCLFFISVFCLVSFLPSPAHAFDIPVAGKKVEVMGYLNQGVTYGIGGDRIDTQEGFQQAIFQGLAEARLVWNRDLRFFVSGKLNVDWAYQALRNDSDKSW